KVMIRIEPEAGHVHAVRVRIGTALVKRVRPAVRAEVMLRDPGVELVERQQVLARKNLQSLDRRADSDRALHAANRAVAARAAQRFRNLGREFNRAAMARAVPHHPQGLSRYHLVIIYLRPLRTFILWWSVAALSVPSGRW